MATLINNTARRAVTKQSRQENKEYHGRDFDACSDCINYNAASEHTGTCAYRLNAPDYPSASVGKFAFACDNFNVPSTRMPTTYNAVFTNIPDQVNFESTKDHGVRIILDLRVISVPDLHRMGAVDQQYPVIAATVQHAGETCVFILPNTKMVKVSYGHPTADRQVSRKIATNRYDLISLFTRISESGKVQLGNWTRLQLN